MNPNNPTIEQVAELPTDLLLAEVWPCNQVLEKDSGLWVAYPSADCEELNGQYEQGANETFRDFVVRCIFDMLQKERPDNAGVYWGIGIDFVSAAGKYSEKVHQENVQDFSLKIRAYSAIDLIRFKKMAAENEGIPKHLLVKLYNATYPQKSEKEKIEGIINALTNNQ